MMIGIILLLLIIVILLIILVFVVKNYHELKKEREFYLQDDQLKDDLKALPKD